MTHIRTQISDDSVKRITFARIHNAGPSGRADQTLRDLQKRIPRFSSTRWILECPLMPAQIQWKLHPHLQSVMSLLFPLTACRVSSETMAYDRAVTSYTDYPFGGPVWSVSATSPNLHLHLSHNHEGRWETRDDFTTSFLHYSLFSSALWDLENSRTVHSLMMSSYLSSVCLVFSPPLTVPCKMVLARPDERETCPYYCSLRLLRWSGDLCGVRLPAGSWHGFPRW